jgi:hypothetical protein
MKRTLILTVTLFLTVSVYSQNRFEPETYFGFKLGGNISGILSDPTISQKINPGLTSGLVFKHISQKSLGIQLELNYKQSGWNENLDSTNIYKRRLNFIELPFMTHVNLGNQKTRFVINLGPYISYLLSEKEKIYLLEGIEEKEYYRKKIDNKASFGLCLGLGISPQTSIGLFQIESRISSSLTDNFKSKSSSPFSSSKNLNAELNLTYMIDYKNLKKSSKKND